MSSPQQQPLDSRQLRAFATLARTGSFTLAAKQLFLSQSAVSHSMKALEREIGCRLLDRMGKKVALTQAGEHLLHHAERILSEMSVARSSIERLGKWGRSRLRISASATACQYILPSVLRDLQKSYPHCLISIEPGDSETAVELMQNKRVDLSITLKPRKDEALEFTPLFSDELVFLVGPNHAWAQKGQAPREEIPRQNYVLYNKQSYTFQMIEQYFSREDMVLNMVIELGSMEAIKELIKLGLGVGILAPWITQKELREHSLVSLPLGRRKLKREWGIVHWRGRRLSMVEETFLSLCRNWTRNLGQESVSAPPSIIPASRCE
jgi:LysR family transcriptional regulator, low CO2-responsive transcriptional regulator